MAQLRHDYSEFEARDVEVVVAGPEDAAAFAGYFEKESLPFVGLPDPKHSVLKLYGQEVKLFKLGRMPAQVLIDKAGIARYVALRARHAGHPRERGAPGPGRRDQRLARRGCPIRSRAAGVRHEQGADGT